MSFIGNPAIRELNWKLFILTHFSTAATYANVVVAATSYTLPIFHMLSKKITVKYLFMSRGKKQLTFANANPQPEAESK